MDTKTFSLRRCLQAVGQGILALVLLAGCAPIAPGAPPPAPAAVGQIRNAIIAAGAGLAAPITARAVRVAPVAPASAAPATNVTAEPPPGRDLPAEVAGKPELADRRTANSATFDLGNGRYTLVQESRPVHYRDADGAWQRIDPAFVAETGGWINRTNALKTGVGARSGRANLTNGNLGVGWDPHSLAVTDAAGNAALWAKVLPEANALTGTLGADGRSVTYPASWSDPTLLERWVSGYGQSEYSLRLAAPPSVPPGGEEVGEGMVDLQVTLRLFPGARVQVQVDGKTVAVADLPLETGGALTFGNDAGETLLLQPPQAYEEGNPAQRVAGRYRLTTGADANSLELAARFPYEWLSASERQYPVVLDPEFQVTPDAQNLIRSATYRNGAFESWGPLNPDTVRLGHQWTNSGTLVDRIFVRFPLPTLPPDVTVTAATLEALADGVGWSADRPAKHAEVDITLYKANANWWTASPPAGAANLGAAQGTPHTLRYSDGDTVNPLTWNVLPLVQEWRSSSNNGVILAATNESCVPCPLDHGYCTLQVNCTGVDFNAHPALEKISGGWHYAGDSGGIRLIVTYTGPTLDVGEIIPDAGDLPFGNPSTGGNYYDAAHEYVINGYQSAHYAWQAIVARGLGGQIGSCPPGDGQNICGQSLNGVVSLDLRSAQNQVLTSTTASGSLSYVLLNRRANYSAAYHAWINPNEDSSPTENYDIRLIEEIGDDQIPINHSTLFTNTFDTHNPLVLRNLVFPANTHNRVDIDIIGNNYDPTPNANKTITDTYAYARYFQMQLFPNSGSYRSAKSAMKTKYVTPEEEPLPYGEARLTSSNFDVAASASYALALAYAGPAVTVYNCHQVGDFCDGTEMQADPLEFTYRVRVTSCSGNTYPTRAGTCQEIKCPTNNTFPPGEHFTNGPFELWSEDGWDGSDSADGIAPMIGPPGATNAPTVAIIGGKLHYGYSRTWINDPDSMVMLVQCRPPADNVSAPVNVFSVYDGRMNNSTSSTAFLSPVDSPWQNFTSFYPWDAGDRADMVSDDFSVLPLTGRVENNVVIRRDVRAELEFFVQSWIGAAGWPSLTSAVNQTANSEPPMPVAGVLTLDLGPDSDFSMDTPAAAGKDAQRTYKGIRALNARISQPDNMGGASNPVRAVIVGVGQNAAGPNQDPPQPTCAENGSYCLDIRAADDVYSAQPNRQWQMPDIHITGDTGLVMVNTPGKLEAWSTDHPAMANRPQADADNFAFNSFGASVRVSRGACGDLADTQIIEGVTNMTLPMVGDDGQGHATAISAGFKLCGDPDVALREMKFTFQSPVGIPVGSTGIFVYGMEGTITVEPVGTTINFGMDFYFSDPNTFNGTGSITISTLGMFQFQGNGKILGVVDGNGSLWVAWNPLDTGFELALHYGLGDIAAIDGTVRAHAWIGQGWQHKYSWLPDNDEEHFAAQIAAKFTIYEGALIDIWPLVIPPVDLSRELEIAFGQFCTNGSCSTYEWGIKAAIAICGYHAGIYYGFDHGVSVILGNDGHTLIDQYGGSAYTRANSSSPLSLGEGPGVRVLAAPPAVNGEVSLPVTVTADSEELLLGLGWQTGALTLNLYDHNGNWVFPNPAFGVSISDTTRTDNGVTTYSRLMGVLLKQPGPEMAGVWEARIGGVIPEAHYKFAYLASTGAPGAPADHGHFIAPGAANANGRGAYNIRWNTDDDAPPSSTISLYYTLYYSRTSTDPALTIYTKTVDVPIVKNWNYHSGLYPWDTSEMKSVCNAWEFDPDCMFCYTPDHHCYYQLHAVVDDGVNAFPAGSVSDSGDFCKTCNNLPPEYAFDANRFPGISSFWSVGKVLLDYDDAAPSVPTGLSVDGAAGALLVRWNANPVGDKDLAGYLVEWGRVYCGADCTWIGGGPTHSERVAPVMTPTLRIGGVTTEGLLLGQAYGVVVSAVDINHNVSAPSDIESARPTANIAAQIPVTPTAPTTSNPTSTGVRLTWVSDGDPDHYRLAYRQVSNFTDVTEIDDIAATDFPGWRRGAANLTGLETGATYLAWVAAANSEDWYSAYSPPVTFTASSGVDSDSDGMPDDWETVHQISFGSNDSDRDGLSDLNEYRNGADPWEKDSDGDGFSDGEEVDADTNPVNGASYPAAFTQPRLRLASHRVNFYAKVGGNDQMFQDISFYNDGGGTLDLSATETAQWLSAAVETGVGKNYVRLSANTTNLAPGIYDVVVQVRHASGPYFGELQCIRVRLHLLPADDDYARSYLYLPIVQRNYAQPSWDITLLDSNGDAGQNPSVAVDPDGNIPYISYYDATNGDLRMSNWVGSGKGDCGLGVSWRCVVVKSTDDVGKYSSIAIWPGLAGSGWKVGVAYYNNTSNSLEYAEYTEGGGWVFTVVVEGNTTLNIENGLYPSLKFDADGHPRIAYYRLMPLQDDSLRYAEYVGGSAGDCADTAWECNVIESGNGAGKYPSLDLDAGDTPHIAYYNSGDGQLRYAHFVGSGGNCGPADDWQCDAIETITTPDETTHPIALDAIGVGSTIKIAYNTVISETPVLKYADSTPGACGPVNGWTCVQIAENVTGVAIAADQIVPRIAYHDTSGRLKIAYPMKNYGNCGLAPDGKRNWQCNILDANGADDTGDSPAIALNSDGLAVIAYRNATDNDLWVAIQRY